LAIDARLRAWRRLLGIGAWTLGWALSWAAGTLLTLPIPRARLGWRRLSTRHWSLGMARLVGMRRRVVGRPPLPPFLLVTNHLSYLDILLLYSCVDGVFIAKRDMRSWPVLGALAQLMGTIWVKREVRRDAVRVLGLIDAAIARSDGVMLFPEGTTSPGSAVMPMKPALLDWAAREQYPVHYAAITYRSRPDEPPAEQALCWWGAMPFGSHLLGVLRMKVFDAIVDFAPQPITSPTRGELAARLRTGIAARFVPVGSENPR
jgi:1-acyl-sn-glycerol-3-phosphate acyltransferase